MFDILRSVQSLEASAKLSHIIEQLFMFRGTYRPEDLNALLDDLAGRIAHYVAQIEAARKGLTSLPGDVA